MNSEIGIKRHLLRLGALLGIRDVKQFASSLDTSRVVATIDIGQGGFMERTFDHANDGDIVGAQQIVVKPLISPLASDTPLIQNNDGRDRRVMAASVALSVLAGAGFRFVSWRWFIKPVADSTPEIDVAWGWKAAGLDSVNLLEGIHIPLTGFLQAQAQLDISDPPVFYPGGFPSLAPSWNRIVPAGWGFYVQLWSINETEALVNFGGGTVATYDIAVAAAPQGMRVPD